MGRSAHVDVPMPLKPSNVHQLVDRWKPLAQRVAGIVRGGLQKGADASHLKQMGLRRVHAKALLVRRAAAAVHLLKLEH